MRSRPWGSMLHLRNHVMRSRDLSTLLLHHPCRIYGCTSSIRTKIFSPVKGVAFLLHQLIISTHVFMLLMLFHFWRLSSWHLKNHNFVTCCVCGYVRQCASSWGLRRLKGLRRPTSTLHSRNLCCSPLLFATVIIPMKFQSDLSTAYRQHNIGLQITLFMLWIGREIVVQHSLTCIISVTFY